MNTTKSLEERLAHSDPVLMDGALGTKLTGQGFLFNTEEWIMANLTHPVVIAGIHASYAAVGAELPIS